MACSDKRYLIAKPRPEPVKEPEPVPEPVLVKAKITEVRLFGRLLLWSKTSYLTDMEREP